MHRVAFLLLFPALVTAHASGPGHDHTDEPAASILHSAHLKPEPSGGDGMFHFHPHLHAGIALGGSSSDKNLGLVRGGHAPLDDGFNLQGIELGAIVGWGERLSLRANHNLFWDRFDGWDGEWEEAFIEAKLPAGFALRGGRFFAPFGHENTLHLHDRAFIEPPISMVRLLGEEGLAVEGAELSWKASGDREGLRLKFGYGQSPRHHHGGERDRRRAAYREAQEHLGESHDHDDDDHHHDDHEDHGHDHAHGLAGNGGAYDAESAYLSDGFFFGRLEFDRGDRVVRQAGVSFAAGRNDFGRTSWVVGADVSGAGELYERPTWWRSEVFYRAVDARDHAGFQGHYDELGLYAAGGLEFTPEWTAGSRIEWASGNRMSGNERRWRAAANIGRLFTLAEETNLQTRLQYTFDRLGGYGDEHSIWLQFVLNFGSGEHGHSH